ncbi:MAG: HAD-IA family hydrolase, partial [Deltaproteobacteria bacterium]|nr:HAD-IA family hydrolase [Deltaproteobacteria bacterium]
GSIDFLKEVKKMGFKMGLATSSLESTAIPSLERIGIKSLFDAFVFGDHVEKGKPSPDIYLLAAKRLGIEPESCLVFEDALNGIKSAKSAGMRVIALNTNDNEEKLVTENPEKIINNFEGVSVKSLVE